MSVPLPPRVQIREVGPRDGLQGESPTSVGERVALIEALAVTGVADIEAVAFVSPRAVPAMAGATEVMAAVSRRPGVRYWALVPNERGAELALASAVDGLSVTVSASEGYSGKNVGMSMEESVAEAGRIAARTDGRVPVDAVISCAFGSPFESDISPPAVAALAQRLLDRGATSITLADTTGMATPRRIEAVLDETGDKVGLHLHDTRGTALVNAYAALQRGIARFDCAVGGLGGSPFAPGAGGNLATEDLIHLLDDLGVETGVDLAAVLAVSRQVAALVGHPVPSRVAQSGPGRSGHAVV
ncbi:MAG: hydroxymethylglutaryl-CoA lyase [Actinomycetota bacterium]|nr:hydroxymethylglutaryl-CoA lyase [Actinomycetota bacterium]MDQ6945048.1 hydroxymethylglutaryl-CoA lyase [Actinomycetota bacterium]